ncbi:HNH endonuclease signature motif containing protein [Nocardia otitidiscaviarum]
MSLTDLQSGSGYAHTASGSVMSVRDGLRMAEGSYPLLMLFDGKGLPLHLGRGRYRLASSWQRLACIAADRGCTRPGCEAPATMCAVHHMVPWLRGGRTDIDNLTLVCDRCHAQIPEDGEDPAGWATLGRGVGSGRYPGRVAWAPPTRIDPGRVPRVNLHHHPEQWLTDAPGGQSPPTLSRSTSPTLSQPKPSAVNRPMPPPLGRQGAGACDRPSPRRIDRDATDHSDRSDPHDRTVPPQNAQRPGPTRGDHLRQ